MAVRRLLAGLHQVQLEQTAHSSRTVAQSLQVISAT